MNISLNQLIQFYLNNTLNLRRLNYTNYFVLYSQNGDRIVSIDYVTSLFHPSAASVLSAGLRGKIIRTAPCSVVYRTVN